MKNKAAQSLGRLGGLKKSETKAASSAENGKLGGRPYTVRQTGKQSFRVMCLAAHGYWFELVTYPPGNSARFYRHTANGNRKQVFPEQMPQDVVALFKDHPDTAKWVGLATVAFGVRSKPDPEQEHSDREAAYDDYVADHGGSDPDDRQI